jgi:hypothetical protein
MSNMSEETKEVAAVEAVTEEVTETPKNKPHEEQAMKFGWRPRDEWEGEPDDFIGAKQFLEKGELIGSVRANAKQLEEVRRELHKTAARIQQAEKLGYDKALVELKKQRDEALVLGEVTQADQLDSKMDEIKYAKKAVETAIATPPVMPPLTAEGQAWVGEAAKSWFNRATEENKAMSEKAISYDAYLTSTNPSLTDIQRFKQVEAHIKHQYPSRFQNTETPVETKRNSVEVPRQNSAATKKSDKVTLSSLSEKEQKVIQRMCEKTGQKVQDYLDELVKVNYL